MTTLNIRLNELTDCYWFSNAFFFFDYCISLHTNKQKYSVLGPSVGRTSARFFPPSRTYITRMHGKSFRILSQMIGSRASRWIGWHLPRTGTVSTSTASNVADHSGCGRAVDGSSTLIVSYSSSFVFFFFKIQFGARFWKVFERDQYSHRCMYTIRLISLSRARAHTHTQNTHTHTHTSLRVVSVVLPVLPGTSVLRWRSANFKVVKVCRSERKIPFPNL